MKNSINVAKDFSKYPGGRYTTDGKYSGEAFRENILIPALNKFPMIKIEMDGTLGYGSSFLEEAFGGLVREHNYTPQELITKIKILSSDPSLKLEINEYISQAKP